MDCRARASAFQRVFHDFHALLDIRGTVDTAGYMKRPPAPALRAVVATLLQRAIWQYLEQLEYDSSTLLPFF